MRKREIIEREKEREREREREIINRTNLCRRSEGRYGTRLGR